jgi:alpha-beta hydrolase superfamily lysophospholipase
VRRWLPAEPPRAVVIALHGFNDYSNAFAERAGSRGTGPYLAAHGFAVIAYDQRGFGRAPDHGRWPCREALVMDLNDVVAGVRAEFPGLPVFGLGESMGGAVFLAALAGPSPPPLAGVVLIAPAVWGLSTMPAAYRAGLWLGVRLSPGLTISTRSMGRKATDNPAVMDANERDPLYIKETRLDAVYGLAMLMDEALASVPRVAGPVLFLYGARDEIIPKRPTIAAMTAFTAAGSAARMAFYPEGWHLLLRDRQPEAALKDVVAFLNNPAGPIPSGADQEALLHLTAEESAE